MGPIILAIVVVVLAVPIYFWYTTKPPPIPELDLEEWWGKEVDKAKLNDIIHPYKVEFSEVMIKDLKDRLRGHRPFTPPLEGVSFEYGFNSKELEPLLNYWAEEYPFSDREKLLNKYPQFKTNIQGLDIHFIKVMPQVPEGVQLVPLLLLHGWPGSIREFYEAIPHLTRVDKDRNFALELIIPSLPGYGFSSAAVRPGLGVDKMAVVFRNLMHRLGYKKYYIQGGDWGGIITGIMAVLFPEEILGYHSNLTSGKRSVVTFFSLLGSFCPRLVVRSDHQDRMYPLSKKYGNLLEESGYIHIQATKPDTVGVALADSPAGLAAYILEKFSSWTRMEHRSQPDGGLTFRFTKDQLIDNLIVYWTSNSVTTSVRLYAESFNSRFYKLNYDDIPTKVPTSVIQAKHELSFTPPWLLKTKYSNLIHSTVLDDGGHFLAFELPEIFANDVLKSIQSFRDWHKNNRNTEL